MGQGVSVIDYFFLHHAFYDSYESFVITGGKLYNIHKEVPTGQGLMFSFAINGSDRSESHMATTSAEIEASSRIGIMVVQTTFDLRFQGSTILNGRSCPIFHISALVLVPDEFTAEQYMACLFC